MNKYFNWAYYNAQRDEEIYINEKVKEARRRKEAAEFLSKHNTDFDLTFHVIGHDITNQTLLAHFNQQYFIFRYNEEFNVKLMRTTDEESAAKWFIYYATKKDGG